MMAARIAIVDDDRDTLDMLQMLLEIEGYDVVTVSNGIRLISSLQVDRPDLILLDVMMSWIDGYELCRALKSNEDYRDIPVIFISAKRSSANVQKGYDCGCVDYFTKPLEVEKLLLRVGEVLGTTDEADPGESQQ